MQPPAPGGNSVQMERTVLHIVGGDSRSRAEQARVAFALGHHAEIYGDIEELLAHPPSDGVVIAADDGSPEAAKCLIARLGEAGVWLPVVFVADVPQVERVVAAIKAGALDYLALPLESASLARRLSSIVAEAGEHAQRSGGAPRRLDAQPPRARSARAAERRLLEKGDRPQPGHQPADGRDPPRQHDEQAGREPSGGRRTAVA